MQQEIEAQFLHVDHNEIRGRLKSAGAELEQPFRLMKRALFDYPDMRLRHDNWARIRVRDEGNKITLSYKRGGEAEYSTEIELTVSSYDDACKLVEAIGLQRFTYQESKRETWRLGDVEIMLDELPWLDAYIEIEGPSEAAIQAVTKQLGFDWSEAKFGGTDTAYRAQYPGIAADESPSDMAELRFSDNMPQWFKERRK